MYRVFNAASAIASSNACRCSSTILLPSVLLFVGGDVEHSKSSPSPMPASHLSILIRLRSALSQSVLQPPILFFNARIFLPASDVAAPFTCACSEIVESDETSDVVQDRRWASCGMARAGVGGPTMDGTGRKESLVGEV